MRVDENPFYFRTSEQTGSDARFVGLFGPRALESFPSKEAWDRLIVIRGAPGGGKTSILRLFTPGALRALHQNQTHKQTVELAKTLQSWGVLSAEGPQLLGVLLSCHQNYVAFQDLASDESVRERQFFALLNARIILAALQGALVLAGREYPEGVRDLTLDLPGEAALHSAAAAFGLGDVGRSVSGKALYDRACAIERSICGMLNDVSLHPRRSDEGHTTLWALELLTGTLRVGGEPVAARTLVMFDDVQLLSISQRAALREQLILARAVGVGRWMAERWHALKSEELFAPGARGDRDYTIVQLDGWSDEDAGRLSQFEKTVSDIANRRAKLPSLVRDEVLHDQPYEAFLEEPADSPPRPGALEKLVNAARQSAIDAAAGPHKSRYADWIASIDAANAWTLESAQDWYALRILIERSKRQNQRDLFVDQALPVANLLPFKSDVMAAAELFLARDQGLSYYHGMRRLAQLGSWNIEQFLDLAGGVFDHILMSAVLKKPLRISAKRQDEVARQAAKNMWDEIPRRVTHGRDVQVLIGMCAEMARQETYRPTAPYSPGVTGFAITMRELGRLIGDSPERKHDAVLDRLVGALTSSVWNNLLQVRLNQKCKHQWFAVFYINRLLCAHFGLPLQYGGFREKKLAEVRRWMAIREEAPDVLPLPFAERESAS